MKQKIKLTTLYVSLCIAFISCHKKDDPAPRNTTNNNTTVTCPTGDNFLTTNQTTASNSNVNVSSNNSIGFKVSFETTYWKTDVFFHDLSQVGKTDFTIVDGHSQPGSGQVTMVLTNLFNQEVYYSSSSSGTVSTCKDKDGNYTVSWLNKTFTSNNNYIVQTSGFARLP
jgi:hypothetical protein